jgi:exopolyphosphatase / guanosine-5'-triphosphate,3'-diphosphate pyrophosphatase
MGKDDFVRVAVIDVGANTARLLVADVDRGAVRTIGEDRAYLELGSAKPDRAKLAEVAAAARRFAKRASKLDAECAEIIVTSPGRQDGATALVQVLEKAAGCPARILSPDQEGGLAFDGALACASDLPEVVAVVDVGGGSSEIVVGTPWYGPAWAHSLNVGSLQLTRRFLHGDPPTERELSQARASVRQLLSTVDVPWADSVLATGGSARAIGRVAGRRYSADDLDTSISALVKRPACESAEEFGINPSRAGTVVGGAIVLSELARLLGRPLEVARGGLREGAALALAAAAEAAEAAA